MNSIFQQLTVFYNNSPAKKMFVDNMLYLILYTALTRQVYAKQWRWARQWRSS